MALLPDPTPTQVRVLARSSTMRIEPARGAVLAAVNLHLPQALPAALRRAVVSSASAFLHTAGPSVKVSAGEFNKAQGPRGGGLALQGPGPERPAGWVPGPVPAGNPTNVVWLAGHPSERELDGSLVGPETPCVGADKVLLSGLSTHQMVQCDLEFADRVFAAADSSCRRFRWSQLRPEQQAPAAAAASLALWRSAHAGLTPDGTVQAGVGRP